MDERAVLRSEIFLSWDGADPWGEALTNLGAICDVLEWTDNGDRIPDSAMYEPGVLGPDVSHYPASMFMELLDGEHIDVDALAYWARILDRFTDLVPEDRRY